MYKKMYYKLFNAITDAINCGSYEEMIGLLKKAQIEVEEMCISETDEI